MTNVFDARVAAKVAEIAERHECGEQPVSTTKSVGTKLLEVTDNLTRGVSSFMNDGEAMAELRKEDKVRHFGLFRR